MTGWKTWAGGFSLILAGGGMILAGASNDFDLDMIMKGVALAGGGLAAIGVGHKIEKSEKTKKE